MQSQCLNKLLMVREPRLDQTGGRSYVRAFHLKSLVGATVGSTAPFHHSMVQYRSQMSRLGLITRLDWWMRMASAMPEEGKGYRESNPDAHG